MNNIRKRILPALMALSLVLSPINTIAEDIDIFTGASAGSSDRPNVLIVLDNTANWSRESQKWQPTGTTQGEAELRAIMSVLDTIGTDVNVGLMEFATDGSGNNADSSGSNDVGFIRFPILPMDIYKDDLKVAIQKILSNKVTSDKEKRPGGAPYGDLAYDMYNYFSGANNAWKSTEKPNEYVDSRGYDTNYSKFKTPLSSANSCAKNYVIFISNPGPNGPTVDRSGNKSALAAACGVDSTTSIALPEFDMKPSNTVSSLGNSSSCYSDVTDCNSRIANENPRCSDGTYSTCSCGEKVAAVPACASGTRRYSVLAEDKVGEKDLGFSSSCTANVNSCTTSAFAAQCTGNDVTCFCDSARSQSCGNNKKNFMVVRKKAKTTEENLGYSSTCYPSTPAYKSDDYAEQCAFYANNFATGSGCKYGEPTTTTGSSCAPNQSLFTVNATTTTTSAVPTGAYDTSGMGSNWNLDEWARCMYQKGVPVSSGKNQNVAFYSIDVYNAQQSESHTALLMSAAHQGGGRYFAATNEGALVNILRNIFAEIQSVNSTFASASLPVNATNRAQNENQVFIGMFRPDPERQPRWYGNLKRYQLVFEGDGITVTLGDKNGAVAVNKQTGFVSDCAVSYWTTDSPINPSNLTLGYYWDKVSRVSPSPASNCEWVDPGKVYSDLPDGPTVEKGAIAEVLRKGNNPPTTDNTPTWGVNRTIYTTEGIFNTGMVALDDSARLDAGDATRKSWTKGFDAINTDNLLKEVTGLSTSQTRASLHGDVVHSRPLPVTYGPNDGVIYYGANDGMFRAVDAETGNELWALMPFEFAQVSFVDRLRNNTPLIKYTGLPSKTGEIVEPKAYGWDGSIGIAQDKNNTKVWIYPTMRRGGQMVYALNVTNKNSPSIMWKHGCYGGSCSAGFENMGQTWSAPVVVPVAGYTTEKVAIFGGGYDTCEDVDDLGGSCSAPKGANVYVVNAGTGALLKTFNTNRSVASEVAVVDMDNDGKADYGYVADTGGNLYRIDMVTRTVVSGAAVYTPLAPADWTIRRIAYAATGQKFLFQPALLPISRDGRVYVAIGTGDREHPLASNKAFSVINSFYVYLDDVKITGDAVSLESLQDKTAENSCESEAILPVSGPSKVGWRIKLNQYGEGEQTVTSALILGGQVIFSTNRPIRPAVGTCSTVLGEARGYWLNLFNASGTISPNAVACGGDRSSVFVGGGLPPSPVTGNVMVDGKPVTVVIGAVDRDGGASTPISPGKVVPVVKPTRSRIYHKVKGVD